MGHVAHPASGLDIENQGPLNCPVDQVKARSQNPESLLPFHVEKGKTSLLRHPLNLPSRRELNLLQERTPDFVFCFVSPRDGLRAVLSTLLLLIF